MLPEETIPKTEIRKPYIIALKNIFYWLGEPSAWVRILV